MIGGLLGPVNWHLVFLVSVPFGVFGTIWAYLKLRDTGERRPARMDWWGNVTFAVGLIAVLVGITYGIQPYGDHVMGWTSPFVLTCLIGGALVLAAFVAIELRVPNPLFDLSLFRIRAFTLGNTANLLASLGRGGLQFVLIIWLQGIWLPQHGYSFEETPLWAGIYMLPLTVGFLVAGPLSGVLSDRMGPRWFSTGGMVLTAVSFVLLELLPVDFSYPAFAALLLLNGVGMGLFSSPNRAEVMNSLPASARGAGAGMNATFQNSGMVLSIGLFFTLMIAGLANTLPAALSSGLTANGVPAADAARIAELPPVAVLFAAFLGYNPVQQLLGPVLATLPAGPGELPDGPQLLPPADHAAPSPTASPRPSGSRSSPASWRRWPPGSPAPAPVRLVHESVGAELAAESGELVRDGFAGPVPAGRLLGTLRRPDGAEVPHGTVTVTTADGDPVGRATVGPDGRYTVADLPPGAYLVVATAPGFRADATTAVLNGVGAVHDFALRGTGCAARDGQRPRHERPTRRRRGRHRRRGARHRADPHGHRRPVDADRGARRRGDGGGEPPRVPPGDRHGRRRVRARHRRPRARPGRDRAGRHRPQPCTAARSPGPRSRRRTPTATSSRPRSPTPRAATSWRAWNRAATRSRPPRSSRR